MSYIVMSKHSRVLVNAGLVLTAAALAVIPALALESDRNQPIQVSADSGELDARTGFTRFTGAVEIRQGTLEVKADSANVYTEDGEITRILLDGEPATWRQQLESRKWMRAEASEIDYDRSEQTILLIGNAYVDHPQGEMSGDRFTYDLEAEKLRGASDTGGRIQMRLEPDVVDTGIGPDNRPDVTAPQDDPDGEPETGAAAAAEDAPAGGGEDDGGDGTEQGNATTGAGAAAKPTGSGVEGDAGQSGSGAGAGSGAENSSADDDNGTAATAGEAGANTNADLADDDDGRVATGEDGMP